MSNTYFQFKQFRVEQEFCAMKVCTDSCLFGAWVATCVGEAKHILDVGSGTGLLSFMLAQKSHAELYAIEIEVDCYNQLVNNIKTNKLLDRIHPFFGDVRSYNFDRSFDVIISNPPFYENALRSPNSNRNLALHSSELPLVDLFVASKKYLTNSGELFVIIPANRRAETEQIAKDCQLHITRKLEVTHSASHKPFRYFYSFSVFKSTKSFNPQSLAIKQGSDYSPEFRQLLMDYYLAF